MQYFEYLFRKYKNKGIIVDTNLMLLLVVGIYDISRIRTFKRTIKYNEMIFESALKVVSQLEQRYLTPYVMTEVDNLARNLNDHEWPALSNTLRSFTASFIEIYSEYSVLLTNELHSDIG
jgi:hypothetical protein